MIDLLMPHMQEEDKVLIISLSVLEILKIDWFYSQPPTRLPSSTGTNNTNYPGYTMSLL